MGVVVAVVWCAHPKLRQANTTLTHKGAYAYDIRIGGSDGGLKKTQYLASFRHCRWGVAND